MKNIIAIGASNSKASINKQFASWVAAQTGLTVKTLDLNDYDMPIYSIDREQESGIPVQAHDFKQEIKDSDGIVISLAEHNGNVTAAFKNITDWVSRIERGTWATKPLLLLSTSPGQRGGTTALKTVTDSIPHQGANLIGSFSLPSFGQNFDSKTGVVDEMLANRLTALIANFKDAVTENKADSVTA